MFKKFNWFQTFVFLKRVSIIIGAVLCLVLFFRVVICLFFTPKLQILEPLLLFKIKVSLILLFGFLLRVT
jgi:Mg/Co/Ni transporter MgtE